MPKQSIDVLIEGGKATAAPPLGPALGPLGVNIGQVVADINKKTEGFKGMQVPVKVTVDSDTKQFTIEVGTPPAASLIMKEAGVAKGASNPKTDKVADLSIEQIIKISQMKEGKLLGKTTKERVKEVIGTCNSMGVMVEGVGGVEAIKLVNAGKFDKEIREGKTEITAEELREQQEKRKKLAEELEKRKAQYEEVAKKIIEEMKGKKRSDIKGKLIESGVPSDIAEHLLPAEEGKEAKGEKKGGAEPAKKPEKK